jgi:hypothetical protein
MKVMGGGALVLEEIADLAERLARQRRPNSPVA